MDGKLCSCASPKVYGRRRTGTPIVTLWCAACECRVADQWKPGPQPKKPQLPILYNDHELERCTCGACVMERMRRERLA